MNNISNIDSLRREKDLLKKTLLQKEQELKTSMDHFSGNYRSILWGYINPLEGATVSGVMRTVRSSILPALAGLNTEVLQSGNIKDARSLTDIAAVLLMKLSKKVFKKKNAKDATPDPEK